MKMMGAELAAVVAGRNTDDTALGSLGTGGTDACRHGGTNRLLVQAVDDDFKHRTHVRLERAIDRSLDRRTKRVVGRSDQELVARADLGARAHNAAWKRHDRTR